MPANGRWDLIRRLRVKEHKILFDMSDNFIQINIAKEKNTN